VIIDLLVGATVLDRVQTMKKTPLCRLSLRAFSKTPDFEFSLATFVVLRGCPLAFGINLEGAKLSHSHPFYLNPAKKWGLAGTLANPGNPHQLKVSGNIPNMFL